MSSYYDNAPEVVKVKIDKFNAMVEEGRYPYAKASFRYDALCSDINERFDEYEGKIVKIAGRLMAKRGQGKVGFYDLMDSSGKIQLFASRAELGDDVFAAYKKLDVGDIIGVSGDSMKNTLLDGERIVISNLFYKPKQGDIVVLTKYSFLDEPIVKRVVAVEGQTIDIDFDKGEVYVDGELLHEDYIAAPTHRSYDVTFPQTVPEGCVFVMGDNRNASNDSRNGELGMVDRRCIMGKAYMIILPINKLKLLG